MKRPRRRRKAKFGKHISISARHPEWEAVQRNAKLRGLSIARYLVLLVERDAAREGAGEPAGPALALKWDEQRELLEAVREIRTLMLEGADAAPLVGAYYRNELARRLQALGMAVTPRMVGRVTRGQKEAVRTVLLSDDRTIGVHSTKPPAVIGRSAPGRADRQPAWHRSNG